MSIRRKLKRWLNTHPDLYHLYTRIRYGARTDVRDWVLSTQAFIRDRNLCTFVFEANETYVRIESGHEFKYAPEQMGGLLGLEFKRGFESADIRSVLSLLPDNPVAVDIGANFGIYSILIASSSEGSQVHSFEPVLDTAYLLRLNADRNRVSARIIINNEAVGSERGNMLITTDRYAGNYLLADSAYRGEAQEVPVIRLDDYVAEKNLQRIDFIKCDVEGAELLVMRGASQVLAHMRPIVMLEIAEEWTRRFGYSVADLKVHMFNEGYECKSGAEVAAELNFDVGGVTKTHNYFFFPRW
jgi:FkbM family methyltransferase